MTYPHWRKFVLIGIGIGLIPLILLFAFCLYDAYLSQLPICDYCGEGYFGKPTLIKHGEDLYAVCDRCWDYLDSDPQYGAVAIWGNEYNMARMEYIYNQVKRSKLSEWNDWGETK